MQHVSYHTKSESRRTPLKEKRAVQIEEKHHRKLKREDEGGIENTPEEDMLAKGTQFYNREGRISMLISKRCNDNCRFKFFLS